MINFIQANQISYNACVDLMLGQRHTCEGRGGIGLVILVSTQYTTTHHIVMWSLYNCLSEQASGIRAKDNKPILAQHLANARLRH